MYGVLSVAFVALLVAISLQLAILIHEAGHALVAHFAGSRVHKVEVGKGPKIAQFHVRNVLLVFRLFPTGGQTLYDSSSTRVRSALIAFGGVGANSVAAGGCLLALSLNPYPLPFILIGGINALFLANLVPIGPVGGGHLGTDGWRIYESLVRPNFRTRTRR